MKKTDTVDSEIVMLDAKEFERLFSKKELIEQKRENENKAEIDQVIDEIGALFNKKELGRIWTPQHLYFKFMELLPNRRKKMEDMLSVSFWPP
ncbi:resistance protein [Trifolium medium]|uniref:Resistance protein n=1 Tax=Trifolium medium TaxID=97028 RepID=A0A392SQ50_9FABA|nr:resistance protein [Trifolium medium]